jgi:hypothetical protein
MGHPSAPRSAQQRLQAAQETTEQALTGPGVTYVALTAYTSTQILATAASQWLSKRQHGKIIF